jgi:hypothetical protein
MKITKESLIDYFEYLDNLRETGVTNMFGAAAYLEEAYDIKIHDARAILSKWMVSFDESLTPKQRVEKMDVLKGEI